MIVGTTRLLPMPNNMNGTQRRRSIGHHPHRRWKKIAALLVVPTWFFFHFRRMSASLAVYFDPPSSANDAGGVGASAGADGRMTFADSTTDERSLQEYMHRQRRRYLNESSIIDLGLRIAQHDAVRSRFLQDFFGSDNNIEVVEDWKSKNESEKRSYARAFADPAGGDMLYGGVCNTISAFRAAASASSGGNHDGGIARRHVLFSDMNENWGAFSTPVPNRTVDWGAWEGHFKIAGCAADDLWWYLDQTNVSAVFAVTHQWLDHPKIVSLPLGMATSQIPGVAREIRDGPTPDRTELLLIAQAKSPTREAIAERVIANFDGTIQNRYHDGSDYVQNLRRSKFVLCPSGMGWDTYRAWEVLCMGAIPVLETYYRRDGFYRTFEDLPVLWVDHYDNVTPSLLEGAYPAILARAREYDFRKLTKQWWADLINQYRPVLDGERSNSRRGEDGDDGQVPKEDANTILETETQHHVSVQNPVEKTSNESVEFEFPPTIDVCNVTTLSFDEDKMVFTGQSLAHVPKSGTNFAYGPWITKSGSTSMINALNYASDNAPSLPDLNAVGNDEIYDGYEFISVLRHPMDRALAGFHQIEVFWLMNWIEGPIDRLGLTWYNRTCLNSTWGAESHKKGTHQCTGSKPETTTRTRLRRLNDFLEEVEERGFWDQHIAPMSYILSSNRFHRRAKYFDIRHIDRLAELFATSAGKATKGPSSSMIRGDAPMEAGMDWVVKWKELVALANEDGEMLARSAIEKLCRLYRSDVTCFPYYVPECDK